MHACMYSYNDDNNNNLAWGLYIGYSNCCIVHNIIISLYKIYYRRPLERYNKRNYNVNNGPPWPIDVDHAIRLLYLLYCNYCYIIIRYTYNICSWWSINKTAFPGSWVRVMIAKSNLNGCQTTIFSSIITSHHRRTSL